MTILTTLNLTLLTDEQVDILLDALKANSPETNGDQLENLGYDLGCEKADRQSRAEDFKSGTE